jgi:LacI family transcriptional regulator
LITLKDIAKMANVSIATVSKVLNNKGRVSEKTKKKVLEIIEQYGYTPDFHARNMSRKNKTLVIGVIVPDITNPFFSYLIRGIQQSLDQNIAVIVMDSFRDFTREKNLINNIRFYGVKGIIIANSRVDDDLVKQVSRYLPVVVFDKNYQYKNVVSIVLDNFYGAYIATKHLIENGYKNIIHLGGTSELYVSIQRAEGYKQAMKENDLKARVYETGYEKKCGYEKTKEIISSGEKFDAIFAMNDLVAIGAMRAIKEIGLKIPEEVGIMGFDNDEDLCEIINPSLSSIDQPVVEMGKAASKLLLDLINGTLKIKKYVFSPRLVVRESSIKGKKHE